MKQVTMFDEVNKMKKYRVEWRQGRKIGAIGIFYPDSVVVYAEDEEAAHLKAYNTHEHLTGINVTEIGEVECSKIISQ